MARVTLIRHGKAEISKPGVQDFDRPLVARGQINASVVGAFLATHRILPQLVLVSPSARTRETYDLPFEVIDLHVVSDGSASQSELEQVANDVAKYCPLAKLFRQAGTEIKEDWKKSI